MFSLMMSGWNAGAPLKRNAAWQLEPLRSQPPPRSTRSGPVSGSNRPAHHCHTLPCMSHSPNLFGGYAPTLVGRPRYFPSGALPAGKLPLKFACSEDRSLVGLST